MFSKSEARNRIMETQNQNAPTAILIYEFLFDMAEGKNEIEFSQERLASEIKVKSRQTVSAGLKLLKEAGVISDFKYSKIVFASESKSKEVLDQKMTLSKLESFLWKTADLLRGSVDPSEYRYYIFGFMFIKRMNDIFMDERADLTQKLKDKKKIQSMIDKDLERPVNYQTSFYIPEGCRWEDIKNLKTNVGEKINQIMAKIEEVPENAKLEGILTNIDFAKKELKDSTILKVINHYNSENLGYKNLEDPDAMGLAYEYLIKQFADQNAKDMGQFFTPRSVVKLLVELLDVQPHQRIYDPTCGTGGILLESLHSLQRKLQVEIDKTKDPKKKKELEDSKSDISLFGQESAIKTYAICRMNLLLHNLKDFDVRYGDTLRDPKHVQNGKLMKFDRILANPPYSLKDWGHSELQSDSFNRFDYGLPPQGAGDYAFVMHMLKSLDVNGKAGVVLPHGVLFRSGAEAKIREGLLEADKIEAIIGLPTNLFYGTGIGTFIMILNNNKPKDLKNKVLFINAELMFSEGKAINILEDNHINEILETYKNKKETKRFSKIVSLEDIKKNDYNLNIKKYSDTALPSEIFDIQGLLTGGIPQEELDNDYNQEILGNIDFNKILEKKKKRYYFKLSKEQLENIANESQMVILNQWAEKYQKSFNDIEMEESSLDKEFKQYLKDMGYESN